MSKTFRVRVACTMSGSILVTAKDMVGAIIKAQRLADNNFDTKEDLKNQFLGNEGFDSFKATDAEEEP
jgi:hypothetical protein